MKNSIHNIKNKFLSNYSNLKVKERFLNIYNHLGSKNIFKNFVKNSDDKKNTKINNEEARYKPIPYWTKSLQWTIVGCVSFGFFYALIARIDEVVISQGDLQSQGAERPLKAPTQGIVSSIKSKEGDFVKKDQIVLQFDPDINDERLNSLKNQLKLKELNLNEEVKSFKAKRNRLKASIFSAEKILDMDVIMVENMEKIIEEGAISVFEYYQQKQKILQLKGEINSNKAQLNEIEAQYLINIQNIRSDLSNIERQIFETGKVKQYESFRSPIDGYVFDLIPSSSGYAASAGETLLKIVPKGKLQAKVFVSSSDVGFLRENMDAEIRVSAYPFTQFGSIKGNLKLLGKEVIPANENDPQPRFPAIVSLERQFLERKDKKYFVSAGQTVTVNFIVRDKPVISLLTDSVEKAFDSLRGIKTDQP